MSVIEVPSDPCELISLWRGVVENFGHKNPAAAEAFTFCADALSLWIKHEGRTTMLCMPPEFAYLVHCALQFDGGERSSEDLANAAVRCQDPEGPS